MLAKYWKMIIALGFLAAGSVFLYIQQNTGSLEHSDHNSSHSHLSFGGSSEIPEEPGQGAFAAMTEIIAMMRANPDTDWSKANLEGLRNHLVDMDRLMTASKVTQEKVPEGLRITIDLGLDENDAASRMVPAHAPVLANETGWTSTVEREPMQLIWTVTNKEDFVQIRSLGFFGLMAVGDHHRQHHWGMANGSMVH